MPPDKRTGPDTTPDPPRKHSDTAAEATVTIATAGDSASELAGLYSARAQLEASRDLGEIKHIRDTALAARRYAEAKKLGAEMTGYAQEIVNRAERRIGQMLAATPPQQPKPYTAGEDGSPRAGVGYKLSARSQQLAALPDDMFESNASKPVTWLAKLAREAEKDRIRATGVAPVTAAGSIEIRHCGIADLGLEPGSADLMFTDPPYLAEHKPLWKVLGDCAAEWLRPGGLLMAYSGTYWMWEMHAALAEHLEPFGCCAVIHDGCFTQMYVFRANTGWKPVLVFRKPGGHLADVPWHNDVVKDGHREKTGHEWQQSQAEAEYWVGVLTRPGDHVVDPFLGSGTTAAACKQLGRRFTGCDIDAAAVATARERVA